MAQGVNFSRIHQVISALENFKSRKECIFNLNKLATYLQISNDELREILKVIFRFQKLFNSVFCDFYLLEKWKNNKIYLVLKLKSEVKNTNLKEQKVIEISQNHINILNDLVYYFQHVKIGSGFDIKHKTSELSKKVSELKSNHPYFFEFRGNGLIYPSKLAVETGNLISFHNKSKKYITTLEVEDYLIEIV
ncbi:MAG: hypothetical protein ACFE96_02820 [Candidatus Hermodarchaeota archaeon]